MFNFAVCIKKCQDLCSIEILMLKTKAVNLCNSYSMFICLHSNPSISEDTNEENIFG